MMERMYYKSDLEITLSFRDADGARISCPDRVSVVFRTDSGRRELELCSLLSWPDEDDNLVVWLPLSRKDIGCGRLRVIVPKNAGWFVDDPGIILTDESYDSGCVKSEYKG